MLLPLEIELLEIVYESCNSIGLRCDGVNGVRLQLLDVWLLLADLQVFKEVEHRHRKELGKVRELLRRDQVLTGLVLFVRFQRDTHMRSCFR